MKLANMDDFGMNYTVRRGLDTERGQFYNSTLT